jgi:DNA polymerase-3 subunit alpha
MNYFCNVQLTHLKSLGNLIGKNLSFGGIVTNVQYRTGKNGKDWAMFTLEGYDESYDFRIFDEEYLKFRHFLVNNQFIYFKINVKDGWVNRETGKKSDPRITFLDAKLLADVLPTFAKKLAVQINIKDIKQDLIQQLSAVFQQNEGDKQVDFEVVETEIVKRTIETVAAPMPIPSAELTDDDSEAEDEIIEVETDNEEEVTMEITKTEVEEIRKITSLEMNSRKLKVKISKELLEQLEKLQVKFKLN